jgi:hypothetical protein
MHMDLVVARPTDCDRLFGKVAHVMTYCLVPVKSVFASFTEPIFK